MDEGCAAFDSIKALKKSDEKQFKAVCQTVREDGAYVEAGENDNLIVQKLAANPKSLGIFGFSFLDQNNDKLQGAFIEGQAPTFENIASGKYSVSRPLYHLCKKGPCRRDSRYSRISGRIHQRSSLGRGRISVRKGPDSDAQGRAKDRRSRRQGPESGYA
jgi:hypothetical protein